MVIERKGAEIGQRRRAKTQDRPRYAFDGQPLPMIAADELISEPNAMVYCFQQSTRSNDFHARK
jgi:hypothetical protein